MKTWGLASLLQAVASGPAPQDLAAQRWQICMQCQEVDSTGQRLLRQGRSGFWCGAPRIVNMRRDEALDGCGCLLEAKVALNNTHCPKGRW